MRQVFRVARSLTKLVEIHEHVLIRHSEVRILNIRQVELLASILDNRSENRIAPVRNRGEEVVNNLMVKTARPPVPEVRTDAPISRANHLLRRPVERVVRDKVVLDVVHNENVLKVVRRDRKHNASSSQSELPALINSGEIDMKEEVECLEAKKDSPVVGSNEEGLRTNVTLEVINDIGDIPLSSTDSNSKHSERSLDRVVPLPRETRVETEPRVSDRAIVIGPQLVGGKVMSDSMLVGPDLGRTTNQVHDLLDHDVDVLVGGHGSVVTHVHEETKTSSKNTNHESPEVRALVSDSEGTIEIKSNGSEDLSNGDELEEVSTPTNLLQASITSLADSKEEGVIRLFGSILELTDIVLAEGDKGLLLTNGRMIGLHQISTITTSAELDDLTSGVMRDIAGDIINLVVNNGPENSVQIKSEK